jgi:hypothetical protein
MSKTQILILLGSLAVVLILFQKNYSLENQLMEKNQQLKQIEKDGIVLNDLKNRWDNKKNYKRLIRFLRKTKPKPKTRTRSKKTTFVFENLTRNQFDRIARKILSSTIKINQFEIKQRNQFRLDLKLEVTK